jgi:putative transposase
MTTYRRNFIAGGSFFFTVNLAERRLQLLVQHIDELRSAFRETRQRHPFTIDAVVILPDHLHTVWTLPEGVLGWTTTTFTPRTKNTTSRVFTRAFVRGREFSQPWRKRRAERLAPRKNAARNWAAF